MALQITRVLVRSAKIPTDMDGYRAAVLADLHDCTLGDNNRILRDALYREDPAALLIAGDMITESHTGVHMSNAYRLLCELSDSFDIYYAMGNHELRWKYKEKARPAFEKYKESLINNGIIFLENSSVCLCRKGCGGEDKCVKYSEGTDGIGNESRSADDSREACMGGYGSSTIREDSKDYEDSKDCEGSKVWEGSKVSKDSKDCEDSKSNKDNKGMGIRLIGLDLPPIYYRKKKITGLDALAVEGMVGAADRERFNVLLAHSPQYFEAYSEWGADLTLSGHFHGGIIRLPLLGGVISPYLRLFPKYDKGIYRSGRGEGRMVLAAGLGTHTFPRINNPAELVLLTFKHGESKATEVICI